MAFLLLGTLHISQQV